MGRFGHENGPFWMLAGAVLVLFFSSIGAVLVCVGRFRPSLGPFWRWAVLVGSQSDAAASMKFYNYITRMKARN